jgi:hypothetical protein
MAQVNSAPGQNQTFGNVAVVAGPLQAGSSLIRNVATLTTVAYTQNEGAKIPGERNPLRS